MALSGWIPWNGLRKGVRLFAFVTVAAVLVSEARIRFRGAGPGADRIERTDDVVLRYHYRPGAEVRVGPNHDTPLTVNTLGLREPASFFAKPGERGDVCHPNSEGHRRIGDAIATAVRGMLSGPPPRP